MHDCKRIVLQEQRRRKQRTASELTQSTAITRHAFLNDKLVVSDTPPVSSATGTAAVTLDTATGKLTGAVTLTNMTNAVTSVHINDGDVGSNGAPVVSLVETPAGSGTWTIPDTAAALIAAQQDRFKTAGLYVVADTSANPGGEIRGQFLSFTDNIQPIFDQHCVGCHNGGGQASSTGLFLGQDLSYGLLVNQNATKSSGVRVVPFDSSDSVLYRRITGIGFSDTQRMPLGGPFLNTHDENLIKAWIDMGAENDSGVLSPQFIRRALLNNIQVVSLAPVLSAATGSATMVLDTTTNRLTGTVTLTNMKNAVTAVHINEGDPGNNGDPVVSLVETPPGSGTWTVPDTADALTAAQQERFKSSRTLHQR